MNDYPKMVTLKDGTKVSLRPMVAEDRETLLAFLRRLPEEDRLFLKDDVTQPEVINRWVHHLDYETVWPLLALVGDEIVGDATLHTQRYGWSRHVGEIRCVVAQGYQGKGIGTILAHEIFYEALQRGLSRIQALMTEDQVGAQKVFAKLGFEKEAVLKDHVTDVKGRLRNLVIMANNTNALWRKLEELYLDMDVRME